MKKLKKLLSVKVQVSFSNKKKRIKFLKKIGKNIANSFKTTNKTKIIKLYRIVFLFLSYISRHNAK